MTEEGRFQLKQKAGRLRNDSEGHCGVGGEVERDLLTRPAETERKGMKRGQEHEPGDPNFPHWQTACAESISDIRISLRQAEGGQNGHRK